jgi:4-oxalocrotonate tautomerase
MPEQESKTHNQEFPRHPPHSRFVFGKQALPIRKESDMPLIQVKVIENVFTPSQKQEIISMLTEAMVTIEGENLRPVTWVVIEEVRSGDWGIGGRGMTTDAVLALAGAAGNKD